MFFLRTVVLLSCFANFGRGLCFLLLFFVRYAWFDGASRLSWPRKRRRLATREDGGGRREAARARVVLVWVCFCF